jgi:HKD family nuclease
MFITNHQEKSLLKRIEELIKHSSELKFLVGFFYFSGTEVLYKALKDIENQMPEGFMKVLVGLSVDKALYGIYEYGRKEQENTKEDLFNSLKIALTSSELDRKEVYEQADFFKKLLLEKKLEIRKTKDPNHAKLYIFKLKEDRREILPGLFITGSSNLTKAGLSEQYEFNVEIKDYGFEEAEKYFDNLWETAIEIKDKDIEVLVKTLEKGTFLRKVTPFQAYVYLLKTYLDLHEGKDSLYQLEKLMEKKGYKPYDYQLSAVSQALANCEAHGGCILADVVGLGKTVIACLTAKALGKRGIVICPPHLIGDKNKTSGWEKYLEDFELYGWEVWSSGKLEDALKFVKDHSNIEVVIVDEAHRFRNEKTESYSYLREICRGKTVLLLSATPFNNSPSDIFALLKLFTIPKKSTITYDEDLEERFRAYEMEFKDLANIKKNFNSQDKKRRERASKLYEKLFSIRKKELTKEDLEIVRQRARSLAREIKAVLEPVVIRRNRLDLKYFKDSEKKKL